jgi:hypothetical protein
MLAGRIGGDGRDRSERQHSSQERRKTAKCRGHGFLEPVGVNVGFTNGGYSNQERAEKPMRSYVFPYSFLLVLCAASAARAADAPAPVHKVTQSASYIMLAPMYATIMDGERPGGQLMIAVGLDIPDPALRAEAERIMPVLRDGYIRGVMAFTYTHVRIAEQPDVAAMADKLQRTTDRLLRQKGARVLLAQVAAHVTN